MIVLELSCDTLSDSGASWGADSVLGGRLLMIDGQFMTKIRRCEARRSE